MYLDEEGRFRWIALFGTLCRGFTNVLIFAFSYLCFEAAAKAQANPGIMSSIFAVSIFLTALSFFLVYRERLTVRHIVGCCCLVACIVLISVDKSDSDQEGSSLVE